jgi:hypothetical protein
MPDPGYPGTIEAVRGRLGDERAAELLGFWSGLGALEGAAAQERLTEVVCILLDDSGAIAGVNSVFPAGVEVVGGRNFWVYRSLLLPDAAEARPAMVSAAFEVLDEEFDAGADGPIGLCLLLGEQDRVGRPLDAEWSDPRLFYAGYLGDGRQVRVGYFEGAAIGDGAFAPDVEWPQAEGYRIDVFADQEAFDHQAVIDFWAREDAVPEAEALRRVHEVHLVVSDDRGELAAVTSAYLAGHPQLRMDLWHYRGFVGAAHQRSMIGVNLALRSRDHLQERYVSGTDTRAGGIVYEVENEGLKSINNALWLPTDYAFVGENERGDHVRVHYFPGAPAPPGPQ